MQTSLSEDSDPWNKLNTKEQEELLDRTTIITNELFRERRKKLQQQSQQQALALAQQQALALAQQQ